MNPFCLKNLLIVLLASLLTGSAAWAVIYEPLPEMPYPADNPPSPEKEKLGSSLFFDPKLSGNNKISCSSCHAPNLGWTDQKPTSIGFENKKIGRNSPTILDSGFNQSQFWDGRSKTLEEQALKPIQSPVEMSLSLPDLVKKLSADPKYPALFKKAFGDNTITANRVAQAIATFERTLKTKETFYDRYWQGDKSAISPSAIRGMELFFGKAKCSICHNGPRFTDNQFHNIGVESTSLEENDVGRKKVTMENFHLRAFKTPGLRYISLTAPYMHNGSIKTLDDVIEFYDLGGNDDPFKSPFISPIGLSASEKKDLVKFLKTLGPVEPYLK